MPISCSLNHGHSFQLHLESMRNFKSMFLLLIIELLSSIKGCSVRKNPSNVDLIVFVSCNHCLKAKLFVLTVLWRDGRPSAPIESGKSNVHIVTLKISSNAETVKSRSISVRGAQARVVMMRLPKSRRGSLGVWTTIPEM